MFQIQLLPPLHHQPVEHIVGQIVEFHLEFQRGGITLIHLRHGHGIPLAEHGDELTPVFNVKGQLEFADNIDHILDLVRAVDHIRQDPADPVPFLRGGIQQLPDGIVGDQAVPGTLAPVEQNDIDGVGDPFRPEDHIVLQLPVLAAAEGDAQVVEPVQQILLAGVHLARPADLLVFLAFDIVGLHLLQLGLHPGPGSGPADVQNAHLPDQIQHDVGKIRIEPLPGIAQGGHLDHLLQAAVFVPQVPFIDGRVGILVHLVDHQQHRGIPGVAGDIVEPVPGPGILGLVTGIDQHHIQRPLRQEDPVHGVHDLLAAEIPEMDLDLLTVQVVFLIFDDDARRGLVGIIQRRAAVAQEPGDGVGFARLAVAQEDHLDLIQGHFIVLLP